MSLSNGELEAVKQTGEVVLKGISEALDKAALIDTTARVGVLLAAAHGEAKRSKWSGRRLIGLAEEVWNTLGGLGR